VVEAIRTTTTNRTVLLVTHDRDLAAIADRVVTLPARQAHQLPLSGELQHSGRR
jgi:ABC-type lipoprotein export system ATPase subunit